LQVIENPVDNRLDPKENRPVYRGGLMQQSLGLRKTASNLPESIHQQLNMYAIAAGAAGVSLLAGAQPADAKIVYTPTNQKITSSYNLDLNGDGKTDFTISLGGRVTPGCSGYWALDETPASHNGAELDQNGALALYQGYRIGFGGYFGQAKALMAAFREHKTFRPPFCVTKHYGNWWDATDRYLGLKFKFHGKPHYGWARLTVHFFHYGGIHFLDATITGYAYETIPGKSIKAGQTKGPADDRDKEDFGPSAALTSRTPDEPQPASLSILALGAQGVPLRRRKESLDATPE
jgi:hypothetical protein